MRIKLFSSRGGTCPTNACASTDHRRSVRVQDRPSTHGSAPQRALVATMPPGVGMDSPSVHTFESRVLWFHPPYPFPRKEGRRTCPIPLPGKLSPPSKLSREGGRVMVSCQGAPAEQSRHPPQSSRIPIRPCFSGISEVFLSCRPKLRTSL